MRCSLQSLWHPIEQWQYFGDSRSQEQVSCSQSKDFKIANICTSLGSTEIISKHAAALIAAQSDIKNAIRIDNDDIAASLFHLQIFAQRVVDNFAYRL